MKTGLVLLLILDVFEFVKTEIRHHQQDRYAKENITAYPWLSLPFSSSSFSSSSTTKRVTEITNTRQQWTVTLPDQGGKNYSYSPTNSLGTFYRASYQSHPTKSVFRVDEEPGDTQKEVYHPKRKNREKDNRLINRLVGTETTIKGIRSDIVNLRHVERRNDPTQSGSTVSDLQITSSSGNQPNNNTIKGVFAPKTTQKSVFHHRGLYSPVAESSVALSEAESNEECKEDIIESFMVTDDVVDKDVLIDRNQAEKLTASLAGNDGELDEMIDAMKSVMEKHIKITSISVTRTKREEKMMQTVFRKGNNLLIDRQTRGYPKFPTTWTPIFRNCFTNTWIFGYCFLLETKNERIDATVYFSVEHINASIDQCQPYFRQILKGGPKCEETTTKCVPMANLGFTIGGYNCGCRDGFYHPESNQNNEFFYSGEDLEKSSNMGNFSHSFKCLPCPDTCPSSCSRTGLCLFQRNNLLRNSILSIQIFCVLTTSMLTILVFKHRKCKTIATGMWTIMEIILLGSGFLYGTVIIRAFNPSTTSCLIEPWFREIGFVLCYGAIILKLYRILIEFRTRKAHRWVVRDKDLLKYLLGMVIVVYGYMSAWTATNLDLIQKENYSMLTTGITNEGIHYSTCKAVWWDYVTETGEILILIFGVHLSYASRNATTQFRERCFLCISISVEAFISGIFYILRYFYWDTMHPDLSLVAYFTRCQLTTTLILLLLFTPKWWYQKVQINKGRVSRNYLMQESGRGPLEAFKPQDGVTATNSDVEGEISLADMNPEDIRAELKRLYTQLEVLKNKTIRFDNPHISKRRGGRKIAHRRFSLQKKGSREKALRQQTQRLSSRQPTDIEVTEAEASRTPEDSVCSNEGPSIIINDGPSDIVHMTPKKNQK